MDKFIIISKFGRHKQCARHTPFSTNKMKGHFEIKEIEKMNNSRSSLNREDKAKGDTPFVLP